MRLRCAIFYYLCVAHQSTEYPDICRMRITKNFVSKFLLGASNIYQEHVKKWYNYVIFFLPVDH